MTPPPSQGRPGGDALPSPCQQLNSQLVRLPLLLLLLWSGAGGCEASDVAGEAGSADGSADGWAPDVSEVLGSDAAATDSVWAEPGAACFSEFPRAEVTSSMWSSYAAGGFEVGAVPLMLVAPLEAGRAVRVSQGVDQGPTHRGDNRWAWDFAVPVQTPVRAAAAGVVVWTRDDSVAFGRSAAFRDDANVVIIDHGGGLYSSYVHFAEGGVLVAPGDELVAGDALGFTGLSGQLSGPNLHFQVENTWSQSVPAGFLSVGDAGAVSSCQAVFVKGEDVVPPEAPMEPGADTTRGHRPISMMPPDAFAHLGVSQVLGMPGRLWRRPSTWGLSGIVEPWAVAVWLLVLPREGGDAVAYFEFRATKGTFAGVVSLADLPAGPYGFALVAVGPGDPVAVDASVRGWLQ